MATWVRTAALLIVGATYVASQALAGMPKVLDSQLELALVAQQPQIVTPTAIACDDRGRLYVLESHTHFRPPDYSGPATDRVRLFADRNGDGGFDAPCDYASGFVHAMGIALGDRGEVYVACRNDLYVLHDLDADEVADSRAVLVRLETEGNYPHNGLSGIALGPAGELYIGLGENLGAPYRLVGADGSSCDGGGEGGSIYRCRADGSQLRRVATGFWNTFALCFDAFGSLFAVDNDPDSRPPCRLLHIVEGGDYGYRYRNGRKGLHPFTAWNGEILGTLPMVCGTGEAPSGVLAYESDGLGEPYVGSLLITSWGDHRIDSAELTPRGASYGARLHPIVQGDENFRPVGICTGPDGAVYFTDWVLKDYTLHGQGRVWRLRRKSMQAAVRPVAALSKGSNDFRQRTSQPAVRLAQFEKWESADACELFAALPSDHTDPFLFSAIVNALARNVNADQLEQHLADADPLRRLASLLALRRRTDSPSRDVMVRCLRDADERVRFATIQWISDDRRIDLAGALEETVPSQATPLTFQAYLAAREQLESVPRSASDEGSGDQYALAVLWNERADSALRAMALAAVPPAHPALTHERLTALLADPEERLAREAVWTLRDAPRIELASALVDLTADENRGLSLRADAVHALAALAASHPPAAERLKQLADDDGHPLSRCAQDVVRARPQPSLDATPADTDALKRQLLAAQHVADAENGRRVFFQPNGVGCHKCHRVNGRGGEAGPDLSKVGTQLTPERLIESILDPSREQSPSFVTWNVVLKDGRQLSGVITHRDAHGNITFGDAQGDLRTLGSATIEQMAPSDKSIMPDRLVETLSADELRDLMAFLRSLQ